MPTQINVPTAAEARQKLSNVISAAKRARERAAEETKHVVQTLEIGGTVVALAAIDSYRGKPLELAGVDSGILLGVALHAVAFAGASGDSAMNLHNFGDGALAKGLYTVGQKIGQKLASPDAAPAGGAPPALPPAKSSSATSGYYDQVARQMY